jgi:hypothetical protein
MDGQWFGKDYPKNYQCFANDYPGDIQRFGMGSPMDSKWGRHFGTLISAWLYEFRLAVFRSYEFRPGQTGLPIKYVQPELIGQLFGYMFSNLCRPALIIDILITTWKYRRQWFGKEYPQDCQ